MEAAAHTDLTGVAVVALVALICGMALERLRQPAIVGYIVAGVVLGPSGLALVEDRDQIDVLAEMGVLLLLFVIGMELSVRAFKRLWKVAVATTAFQIGASLTVMFLFAQVAGLPVPLAVFLGFTVAMSSTAVAIKILDDIGELRTRAGRITVGVLIAQDLAVVPMMLIIAAMGGDGFDLWTVPKILLSLAVLAALIVYLAGGRKLQLPFADRLAKNEDLKPLAALALCFGLAAIAGLAGLSAAYGAFLAGMVIGNSTARNEMMRVTLPIQSILMMAFFLSIGLLIDLDYMWRNIGTVLTLFLIVTVFKTVVNVGFLGAIGQPWQHAFLAGVAMAQIGEFSFLLSVVAADAGVVGDNAGRLVVAVTVLSLALSPLWVFTARRLRLLASYGITEAGDLSRLVYGPETEFVSNAVDLATTRTQRWLRGAALNLRRSRQRRRRRKEAAKTTAADAPTAVAASAPPDPAEIPEPAVPPDQPVPQPSPPAKRKPRRKPSGATKKPAKAAAKTTRKRAGRGAKKPGGAKNA